MVDVEFLAVEVPVLLLGLGLVAGGLAYDLPVLAQAAGAETVEGEVTEVRIEAVERAGGPFRAGDMDTQYRAVVEYTYEYGGQSYTGRRLYLTADPRFETRAAAEEAVADYREGGTVTVTVDPESPAVAYLEPGLDRRRHALTGGGVLVGAVLAALAGRSVLRRVR